ncbi:MAG: hypothetical protein ACKPKO_16255, partial [Candidatus Fonsibacter sp.]
MKNKFRAERAPPRGDEEDMGIMNVGFEALGRQATSTCRPRRRAGGGGMARGEDDAEATDND